MMRIEFSEEAKEILQRHAERWQNEAKAGVEPCLLCGKPPVVGATAIFGEKKEYEILGCKDCGMFAAGQDFAEAIRFWNSGCPLLLTMKPEMLNFHLGRLFEIIRFQEYLPAEKQAPMARLTNAVAEFTRVLNGLPR